MVPRWQRWPSSAPLHLPRVQGLRSPFPCPGKLLWPHRCGPIWRRLRHQSRPRRIVRPGQSREAGVPCTSSTAVHPVIYEAIRAAAHDNNCDLIFMASHGRRGLAGLLIGSETSGYSPTRNSRCWWFRAKEPGPEADVHSDIDLVLTGRSDQTQKGGRRQKAPKNVN